MYDYVAPTTPHTAELIVAQHGAASIDEFVQRLPDQASVLDVGSGDSTFGLAVAEQGRDKQVHVTTVDLVEPRLPREAPSNLRHIVGSAARLTDYLPRDSQDYTASYFLLPHVDAATREQVVREMYAVTKPGGVISAGPWLQSPDGKPYNVISALRALRLSPAKQFTKGMDSTPEEIDDTVRQIVQGVTIPAQAERLYTSGVKAANEVLRTNRWYIEPDDGKVRHTRVYNPRTGEYTPLLSPTAIMLIGRVALHTAAYFRAASPRRRA